MVVRDPMVVRDQHGYIIPAFSGSQYWDKSIWQHNPYLLRVPNRGKIYMAAQPPLSRSP